MQLGTHLTYPTKPSHQDVDPKLRCNYHQNYGYITEECSKVCEIIKRAYFFRVLPILFSEARQDRGEVPEVDTVDVSVIFMDYGRDDKETPRDHTAGRTPNI